MESGSRLLVVRTDVSAEVEPEFNAWYDEVHLPEIVAVPGILSGRRFRVIAGNTVFPGQGVPTYLAMYDLDTEAAVGTPEFVSRRGWAEFGPHVRNNQSALYEPIASLPN